MSTKKVPIVAIVGRANVGKSSLFNAVLKRREAVVAMEAGTTRDSITAKASIFVSPGGISLDARRGGVEAHSKTYTEVRRASTGDDDKAERQETDRAAGSARRQGQSANGYWQDFWLVDTAGLKTAEDDFEFTIQEQIIQATDSADLIIVVVEAMTQITEEDRRVATLALKSRKPVALIVNKVDQAMRKDLAHFERLGIKPIIHTSATQNYGIEDMLEHIASVVPQAVISEDDDRIHLAILGRPNVGKSALFNTLARKQQAIVADRAGTTRDVNRAIIKFEKREIELMDTAGIRRSGKIEVGIEKFSVIRSLRAIEESDVCVLLMDVHEFGTQLDQKIAGLIKEAGKGLIIAISKWDSFDKDAYSRDTLAKQIQAEFEFVPWAPLVFTSSVSGQNVTKLFEMARDITAAREIKVPTSKLNTWLKHQLDRHPPAGLKNSHPKLNYMVQVTEESTPTFKIFGAHTKLLHWSYKRYLEKELREEFGFIGTSINLIFLEKHIDRKKDESYDWKNRLRPHQLPKAKRRERR